MHKKLSLRRETVRVLSHSQLRAAAGGMIGDTERRSTVDTHPMCGGPSYGCRPDTRYMNTCDETDYAPCL